MRNLVIMSDRAARIWTEHKKERADGSDGKLHLQLLDKNTIDRNDAINDSAGNLSIRK